jgi:hypothetical protein
MNCTRISTRENSPCAPCVGGWNEKATCGRDIFKQRVDMEKVLNTLKDLET